MVTRFESALIIGIYLGGIAALGATTNQRDIIGFGTVDELVRTGNPRDTSHPQVAVMGYTNRYDGYGGFFVSTNTVTSTNSSVRIYSGVTGYSWERISYFTSTSSGGPSLPDSNWRGEGLTNSTLSGISKQHAAILTNSVTIGTTNQQGVISGYSTNGTYFYSFAIDSSGFFNLTNNGTKIFSVSPTSGWAGGGTLVLADDGLYKSVSAVGAGGGNVVNTGASVIGYVPSYTDVSGTNQAASTALLLSGTNSSARGILSASGFVSTNWAFVLGNIAITTAGSTNDFTNKGYDYSGAGNSINLRPSIKLQIPAFVDGVGCIATNTNYVSLPNFMVPVFSGTDDTNANNCYWIVRVPKYFNAAGADVIASLSLTVGGSDADAASFTLGMVSVADGSNPLTATPANYNTITVTPTTPAAGVAASSNDNTMSGWKAATTPNQLWKIQLQRVNNSNDDPMAMRELEIFYDEIQ